MLQKNWCLWTVVLEKTPESPLDCKEIKLVHPKGNRSRIFIGRTDSEAETPILWPPDAKKWLTGKDPDAGQDWRKAGGEEDDRGWDGWMASLTQWTWVWASSGSWWWTGKPDLLQSMGSQRVRHDWGDNASGAELGLKDMKTVRVDPSPTGAHSLVGEREIRVSINRVQCNRKVLQKSNREMGNLISFLV